MGAISRRRFLALGLVGATGLVAAASLPAFAAAQAAPNVGSVTQLVIAQGGGASWAMPIERPTSTRSVS